MRYSLDLEYNLQPNEKEYSNIFEYNYLPRDLETRQHGQIDPVEILLSNGKNYHHLDYD